MMLPFAQWQDRCKLSCMRDAQRLGLSAPETARELRFAAWLEQSANPLPKPYPLPPAGAVGGGPVATNPHAVAQPNWNRLGFAGPEDAEGRN